MIVARGLVDKTGVVIFIIIKRKVIQEGLNTSPCVLMTENRATVIFINLKNLQCKRQRKNQTDRVFETLFERENTGNDWTRARNGIELFLTLNH